jgi:hypothetical protein
MSSTKDLADFLRKTTPDAETQPKSPSNGGFLDRLWGGRKKTNNATPVSKNGNNAAASRSTLQDPPNTQQTVNEKPVTFQPDLPPKSTPDGRPIAMPSTRLNRDPNKRLTMTGQDFSNLKADSLGRAVGHKIVTNEKSRRQTMMLLPGSTSNVCRALEY